MIWFLLGFIVAFGICGIADTKSVNAGKIRLKGKWYRLVGRWMAFLWYRVAGKDGRLFQQ